MKTVKGLREIGHHSKAVNKLFNKTIKKVPEIKESIMEQSEKARLKNMNYYNDNREKILGDYHDQKKSS